MVFKSLISFPTLRYKIVGQGSPHARHQQEDAGNRRKHMPGHDSLQHQHMSIQKLQNPLSAEGHVLNKDIINLTIKQAT